MDPQIVTELTNIKNNGYSGNRFDYLFKTWLRMVGAEEQTFPNTADYNLVTNGSAIATRALALYAA